MKFSFKSLPIGFKILFVGIILALLALLLPWRTEMMRDWRYDFSYKWQENPFTTGEFLIALPLLYHLGYLLLGKTMNRKAAFGLGILPFVGWFIILPEYNFDSEPGAGLVLFPIMCILAYLGLLIGIRHTSGRIFRFRRG